MTPTPPVALARTRPADPEAAAPAGRVRLRAGVRRLVRGRGAGRDPQHEPRVGGDLRRLPLRVVARRAAAEERAVVAGCPLDAKDRAAGDNGLLLAKAVKRFRPELDIILLADRKPEAMISDPAAAGIRRVFYEVEEPLEIHLSILSGVAERNETPFFDNLKKYAQKPVGTFHALPVARGKSIFKSNWIRDMGEFYGANLFLAESSATSRRAGQPARAHRQHQEGPGRGRARLRRRPRVLRDQRHVDLQQDGPPGAARAGRHRDRRSQLPQVAPLRDGAGGGAAVLRRGLPDGGVLDVRRRAAAHHQEGACSTSRRRAGSTR